MPAGKHCHRRGMGRACSCEMGNLYRFAEPIVLLTIARLKDAYGYQIAQEASSLAVTHAGLDTGVIYRTLRRLEDLGRVQSSWNPGEGGPARRIYRLTEDGREHIREWSEVLKDLATSLQKLQKACAAACAERG